MTIEEFEHLIAEVLGQAKRPNRRQMNAIVAPINQAVPIVAGPGSGKTAVLVLRALRHVLVDRFLPETILVTTFTVKAAKEIRTRLLEWGEPIVARAAANANPEFAAFLDVVDVNRFVTGTLDGICQEALGEQRLPGERRYVVVEGFAADVVLSRVGRIFQERREVASLDDYLGRYSPSNRPPRNNGDAVRTVRGLVDRFVQDGVDLETYSSGSDADAEARRAVRRIYDRYVDYMTTEHRMDFALLERTLLDRLVVGRIPPILGQIRALLVDEYQDSNPLQERIYLELARATSASMTVVGDDDQSLYRFRGATIELFRAFRERASETLGTPAIEPLYLVENYRSTGEIVDFYNAFIAGDPDFAGARIQPPKPRIVSVQGPSGMPVLGLFRDDVDDLARDLAGLLHQIFRGGGRPADTTLPEAILPALDGGDLGDAVLLSHTAAELNSSGGDRLPRVLRARLAERGLGCFNPRGRALRDIPEVGRLLGLVTLCLEPGPVGLSLGNSPTSHLTNEALRALSRWRADALDFLASDPPPVREERIDSVVRRWQRFAEYGGGSASEWPILDVFYDFIPWMPGFRDDPEGQVYLEAISRCASQAATFSSYRGTLVRDDAHRQLSIAAAIRDAIVPIAEDLVDVDEDIMPSVPRDRLNVMTIHQAKGLEFPLVIVDVASDFRTDHHTQAFRRFPRSPSNVTRLEDDLAAVTPIGPLRLGRDAMQRSFEDIVRLNYVAYSRPQSLLLLVGLVPSIRYNSKIKNVALGWRRDGTWSWRRVTPSPPSVVNDMPLVLI